jgi:hypothetical protein
MNVKAVNDLAFETHRNDLKILAFFTPNALAIWKVSCSFSEERNGSLCFKSHTKYDHILSQMKIRNSTKKKIKHFSKMTDQKISLLLTSRGPIVPSRIKTEVKGVYFVNNSKRGFSLESLSSVNEGI